MKLISNQSHIWFLFKYLRTMKDKLALLAVALSAGIALQIIKPRFIQQFIDGAGAGLPSGRLIRLAVIFLALAVVEQLAVILTQYLGSLISWEAGNRVRKDLVRHCLALDLSFHNAHTPGELVQRIDGDVESLGSFFSTFTLQILGNLLLMLGILIVIFTIHVPLGILVTVLVLAGGALLFKIRDYSHDSVRKWQGEQAELLGFLDERITGREDIQGVGAQAYTLNRFHQRVGRLIRLRNKNGIRIGTVINAGEMVVGLLTAITLGMCGYLFLSGRRLSTGTIVLIYYYLTILVQPLRNIVYRLGEFQQIKAALTRVMEILSLRSRVEDQGSLKFPGARPELLFSHVRFGYPEGRTVLQDVTFRLPAGKCLGVVGRTGSGKTTLARLICRFYDCDGGALQLNGKDVREYELKSLRESIGMITQQVELFQASLRDNIRLFREEISDEAIIKAMEALSLGVWLTSLPEGLDTVIHKDGANLSAGEAQIIALCRVFLHDPSLVILDEATSRLDPVTENLLRQAVDRLLENRTAIVIAHRLSTLKKTDFTLVLEEGRVLEF